MGMAMAEFDVAAFVAKMDGMGVKLTAVPLADGKVRVSRWRMMQTVENAKQAEDLWIAQIGNNQARIDVLAKHLTAQVPPAPRGVPSQAPQAAKSVSQAPLDSQAPVDSKAISPAPSAIKGAPQILPSAKAVAAEVPPLPKTTPRAVSDLSAELLRRPNEKLPERPGAKAQEVRKA
jgi:hypothetical protein